ncbi:hypothetical protein H5410_000756 [Solanum commersonii]|uniref:Uncharacterized protein n=1 Tax=Solanum commersonii TaxID=4109 RepID=A0A9J6AY60_SOLCO|nr:hypothetical protein H5410_000756 [Solanum commersonii]
MNPKTKMLYGQELLDLISKRIQVYGIIPQKEIIADSSLLGKVNRSLLLNITQYEKSDTSMRSETSEDATDYIQEAQLVEATTSKVTLRKAEDFLHKLKEKDKICAYNGLSFGISSRCTEEEASLWEILEFIKLILPLCMTGELEEDLYDDLGDDLPLPLVLFPLPMPLVTQGGFILQT